MAGLKVALVVANVTHQFGARRDLTDRGTERCFRSSDFRLSTSDI
ncbi:MAG TPA: hypothetical protein VGK99_08100 [Acidobacteriota bacterium]|jgi:hypothetical protein